MITNIDESSAMTEVKKSYKDMMADLRKDYIASLQERMNLVREALNSLDWPALYTQFHKLKGTGKTYGCPEISYVASPLEALADSKNESHLDAIREGFEFLERISNSYIQSGQIDEVLKNQTQDVVARLTLELATSN
jgi:HPt (histidine-containing phosphotransfer) domain-containing protein